MNGTSLVRGLCLPGALLCMAGINTVEQTKSASGCDHPPPPVYGDSAAMKVVRDRAWQLYTEVIRRRPVYRSPHWIPKNDVFTGIGSANKAKGVDLFQAAELRPTGLYDPAQFSLDNEFRGGGGPIPPQPLTYESTFFNLPAVKHIRNEDYPLYSKDTTTKLLNAARTEIPDFPQESMIVKTFWRVLPNTGSVPVGVWGWKGLPHNAVRLLETYDFPNGFVCVELNPAPNSRCLDAKQNFFITSVKHHGPGFDCSSPVAACIGNLPEGQKLILLAMHIASKERPDWFWATFWWKGVKRADSKTPETAPWTCDNAQRPRSLAAGVAGKYAMDVTIGLNFKKPQITGTDLEVCGSPPTIGLNEELRAAFNPFVEELRLNGRKSSCINCHARADTNPDPTIPKPCDDDTPPVKNFEGHIRTDYLWSIPDSGLANTLSDPPRHQP